MAKLPVYDRQAPLMADVPQLQTPQYAAYAERSKSIQGALDVIGKYAAGEAEKEVIKEAQAYTVANPLSASELEKSKQTGENPIESALNGGRVWNDAIQKLYAQQASTELTNSTLKHFIDIEQKVKDGELTDAGQIQQALQSKIKSYANVINQIDPEEGSRFYARATTNGNAYYKSALGEIRKQEQARQDQIALELLNNNVITWSKTLEADDIPPELLLAKWKADRENAKLDFKNSSKRATHEAEVDRQYTTAFFNHISKQLQKEFSTSEEVLLAFRDGKLGNYQKVIDGLNDVQKNALESVIKNDFILLDSMNTKKLKSAKDDIKEINEFLLNGGNPKDVQKNIKQIKDDVADIGGSSKVEAEAALADVTLIEHLSENFKNHDIQAIQSWIDKYREDPDKNITILAKAEEFVKKLDAQRTADPVAFQLRRKEGTQADANILLVGRPEEMKAAFKDQLNTITTDPLFADKGPVLTKPQASRLEYIIQNKDDATKMELAKNIVLTFGDNAINVFNQIAPKQPAFAQIGLLAADGYDLHASTIDQILQGGLDQTRLKSASKLRSKSTISNDILRITEYNQEMAPTILAAADAVYAANASDSQLDTLFDEKLYMESLNKVVGAIDNKGGIMKFNEEYVILPNTIPQSDMEDMFTFLDKKDIFAATVNANITEDIIAENGLPYPIEDLQDAQLIKVDDGYQMHLNGRPFRLQDGSTLTLDLEKLHDLYIMKDFTANKEVRDVSRGFYLP